MVLAIRRLNHGIAQNGNQLNFLRIIINAADDNGIRVRVLRQIAVVAGIHAVEHNRAISLTGLDNRTGKIRVRGNLMLLKRNCLDLVILILYIEISKCACCNHQQS